MRIRARPRRTGTRQDCKMDDALKHGGSPGGERDDGHDKCQRQQHPDPSAEPEFDRLADAIETAATTGIVRPMLASADPSARLRLVCSRLHGPPGTRQPLGQEHSAAMAIPTVAFGAFSRATAISSAGSAFWPGRRSPRGRQTAAGTDQRGPVRGGGACASSSCARRQEVVAVTHRLDEDEGSVEHATTRCPAKTSCDVLNRARNGGRDVRQHHRQRGQRSEHRQRGDRALDLEALFVVARAAAKQAYPDDAVADDHDGGKDRVAGDARPSPRAQPSTPIRSTRLRSR